ncbi:MAG: cupredoxin domain-containing protein [Actinomycetota bacterium]
MSDNPHTPKPSRNRLLLPILLPIGLLAGMAVLMILFAQILLNTSTEAATIVALVVATAVLVVGGIAASRGKLGIAGLGSMLGVVAGVAMITGAIALAVSPPGEHGGEQGGEPGKEPFVASIAAPPGASVNGFEPDKLTFAADVPIELEFDNQEQGVVHNVEIFDSEDDASGPLLFSGAQITGPVKADYQIDPLREGTYFFNCVVHPTTMTGQVRVEKDASTGGTLAQSVVAQNLEFDTDQLDLTPETESTVTLDNRDPGIPHNIAIYVDDSLSEILFQGETFPGPAVEEYVIPGLPEGQYFFQCDVHPTMAGQVVVAPAGPGGSGGDAGGGGSGANETGSDEGG